MKKLLIILLVFTCNAHALNCGETERASSQEVSTVQALTDTPKFLKGATITLTQANGHKEVVSEDEYMIVKRKHPRLVVKETIKENSLTCTKTKDVNIASVKLVDGYSQVENRQIGNTTTLKVERQVGIGLQYQRNVNKNMYLGGEVDTNRGAGLLLGVGF